MELREAASTCTREERRWRPFIGGEQHPGTQRFVSECEAGGPDVASGSGGRIVGSGVLARHVARGE
jgi:hypothetical protein